MLPARYFCEPIGNSQSHHFSGKRLSMYELIFGFQHCFGKTEYRAGKVDSREDALLWVAEMERGEKKLPVPETEPLRTCPVTSCPIRRQVPWFSFRKDQPGMQLDGKCTGTACL